MKKSKLSRKEYKKALRTAVHQELREHRSSFFVYLFLRALVILTLIRQIMLHNYEGVFFSGLTILLFYIPSWLQVKLHIELPPLLEIIILCFIFAAEILGEVNAFYIHVPHWDTMLHTLNGFLAAAVGFSLVVLLNDDERLTFDLSPFFLALMAFCFSMTIGVLWEFFEFSMDQLLHVDMQKDTVIHAIYSVGLNPDGANRAVAFTDITETVVNGRPLGIDGYLDIGLIDTMKDLFVNFIGALVSSVFGYFYARRQSRRRISSMPLVPSRKTDAQDYLLQAEEAILEASAAASASEDEVLSDGSNPFI